MSDKNNEMQAFLEAAPDTRYIEILAPDMNGILRGKRVEAVILTRFLMVVLITAQVRW